MKEHLSTLIDSSIALVSRIELDGDKYHVPVGDRGSDAHTLILALFGYNKYYNRGILFRPMYWSRHFIDVNLQNAKRINSASNPLEEVTLVLNEMKQKLK